MTETVLTLRLMNKTMLRLLLYLLIVETQNYKNRISQGERADYSLSKNKLITLRLIEHLTNPKVKS